MSWQRRPSLWADVRVSPVATDALVRELAATAAALGEVAAVLEADGTLTDEEWGGPHRKAFDADRSGLVANVVLTAERLLLVAAEAAALLAAGEGEQRLRERLRRLAQAEEGCAPRGPC